MSTPTLTGTPRTDPAVTVLGGVPPRRPTGWWREHRTALTLVGVLALVAMAVPVGLSTLGATSSSTSAASAGSASSESGSPGAARDALAAPDSPSAPASGGGTSSAGAPLAPGTTDTGVRIARSAWLGIEVADLTRASASARLLATSAGGQVTSENVVTAADPTGSYGGGDAGGGTGKVDVGLGAAPDGTTIASPIGVDQARLTLSVPATALDGVLSELSRLGSVSYRSSSSEDVTDSYVDTKARIGPMRDSVSSVRALLAKATDLQQVIALENELTRRQADLDSLTQRLAQLDRRTTMSDVTATFWTSATASAPRQGGAGGALVRAWDGFLASAAVILTGLAVLLPWAVLGLAVAWVVWRIRARRNRAAAAVSPSSTP
ncbi:MAG: DUF4349 domain-containing protein [Terracoccus sp.]